VTHIITNTSQSKIDIVGFEHLHLHTDFSTLDGFGMVEEYAMRAPSINQKFLTISDHGMLGAIPRQIKACDKINDKFGKDTLSPIYACLPAGSPIHTKCGVKDIQCIEVGDLVLTHLGRFKKVTRLMSRLHTGDLYSVKLSGIGRSKKTLKLTGEHPVLIFNRDGDHSWIPIKDVKAHRLTTGNGIFNHSVYVGLPKMKSNSIQLDYNLIEYQPDRIKIVDSQLQFSKRGYKKIWHNLPLVLPLDEDFAYFLGLFAAEGSFSIHDGKLTGGMTLSLNKETEWNLAKKAADFLAKFKIDVTCRESEINNKMDATFCCLPLAYLISNIVGVGCKNKKIPDAIFSSSLSVQNCFLNGLLDGDGKNPNRKSNKSKQRTLKVASSKLAYQCRLILANLGKWTNVYSRCDKGKQSYILPISSNDVPYVRNLVIDDFILKPISSIELDDVEEIEVFNFEVEEDNSYVSDFILHNCELYVNRLQPESSGLDRMQKFMADLNEDEQKECKSSSHLLAIAYNEVGYKNLVRLSSWAWTKGFYRRPRVNYEQLQKCKEGLFFTSCCYNSEVGRAFDQHGEDAAFDMIEQYIEMFGKEHYLLEIMLLDFKKQKPYNAFIIKAKEKYGLKIILTNDCHYCQAEDSHYQRLMLMVQTGRTLEEIKVALAQDEVKDFFELQDSNLWMKSEEELNDKWEKDYQDIIPYEIFCEAKRTTVDICNKAKGVQLDRSLKLPVLDNADEILKEEVMKGFKKRGLPKTREYTDRIKEEYGLITRKGFSSYFLIQKMMTDEARRVCRELIGWGDGSQAVGPGRGSAVGALTCYCLGITNVDPIREGLLFSRFMSEARGGRSIVLEFKNMDPLPAEEVFHE
jgi:DNA polymerase III subunit alpha